MLTEVWLKANNGKLRDKVTEIADRDGMSVRISPKGKIVFQLRYRFNGKLKRFDLGVYPLISLKQAREKSLSAKTQLLHGKDPKLEEQIAKQAYINADTFYECFLQWYDKSAVITKKQASDIKRSFELYVFPVIGSLPINDITLQQYIIIIESISEKTPGIAERILTNTKQMLKWAKKREIVTHNILADLELSDFNLVRVKRKRYLSDDEIILFYKALYGSKISYRNRLATELALMFGCRGIELRRAKITDFQDGVWTVPPENHKVGHITQQPLIRPILPPMQALIDEAIAISRSEYLFDRRGEMLEKNAFLDITAGLMHWIDRHCSIQLPRFTFHDLRRTARTNFSAFTSRDIAEIMIGHTVGNMQQVYDHYNYLPQQTAAYEQWLKKLAELKQVAL
ncbi:tyrosine-type recombinase/integrase [Moraxella catarrhalis]|uniref:tyrosine-type recombinase/integrase n=1 Tax=Moraxella catarrhalis TaxID=480 RepID=UPI00128CDC98|nr:integrase family protein [Moraxella catarrhalis]MPX14608.1 integrase [Moraxella catarrhalis]